MKTVEFRHITLNRLYDGYTIKYSHNFYATNSLVLLLNVLRESFPFSLTLMSNDSEFFESECVFFYGVELLVAVRELQRRSLFVLRVAYNSNNIDLLFDKKN